MHGWQAWIERPADDMTTLGATVLLYSPYLMARFVLYKCFSTNVDVVQFIKGLIFAYLDHGLVLRVFDMKGSTVHILDGASS